MFSSAPAMTPSSVPTGEESPSAASCLRSTPSPRATSSITALSVSTSASTSPLFTWSPSDLSHFTRRPSSIVGESASITTLVAMALPLVEVHDLPDRRDRLRRVGLRRLLEILGVRHWHVLLVHTKHWRIEVIEAFALDVVGHLRADAAHLPAFLEHDGAIRLSNGRVNGLDIHWSNGAQVDDVDPDSILCERVGHLHADQRHLAVADDRAVISFALQVGDAERDDVIILGHLALGVVQHLALEDDHRVRVADRGLEQPLRIVWRPRADDLEP